MALHGAVYIDISCLPKHLEKPRKKLQPYILSRRFQKYSIPIVSMCYSIFLEISIQRKI